MTDTDDIIALNICCMFHCAIEVTPTITVQVNSCQVYTLSQYIK